MIDLWRHEPALIIGFVQALIALAVAFGLNLTPEQVGGIVAALTALAAFIVRSNVYAPANVPGE